LPFEAIAGSSCFPIRDFCRLAVRGTISGLTARTGRISAFPVDHSELPARDVHDILKRPSTAQASEGYQ
jgi:hypothetical protein